MSIKMKLKFLAAAASLAVTAMTLPGVAGAGPLPSGWSTNGNAGQFMAADGVVTMAPGFTAYQWVTTNGGNEGGGALPAGTAIGGTRIGATMSTPTFSAVVADKLDFRFNYITSDGAGFSDYAWAALFDGGGAFQQYLFTARTTTSGNTVPGFGLPGLGLDVTLDPSTTAIIPGGPTFSPLGTSSGACFSGGCGYTGWIKMNYTFTAATGDYFIRFGVSNVVDNAFNSAFAVAGVSINNAPINNPQMAVPEPGSLALVGLALAGLAGMSRRRRAA